MLGRLTQKKPHWPQLAALVCRSAHWPEQHTSVDVWHMKLQKPQLRARQPRVRLLPVHWQRIMQTP